MIAKSAWVRVALLLCVFFSPGALGQSGDCPKCEPVYDRWPCGEPGPCQPCDPVDCGPCYVPAAGDPPCIGIGDGWYTVRDCCGGPTPEPFWVCVGSTIHLCGGGSDTDTCEWVGGPGCGDPPPSPRALIGDGFTFSWNVSGGDGCRITFPDEPDCEFNYRVTGLGDFTVTLIGNDRGCLYDDGGDLSCSVEFHPVCCGPSAIEAGGLCPDGKSTTIARTWHVREVEWSFVGDSLGCRLEKCPDPELSCWPYAPSAIECLGAASVEQSVRVRAGKRNGEVTVRARDKIYPDCYVDQKITVGCGGCSAGSCSPGQARASIGKSLDIRFPLGKASDGESAGELVIYAEHASTLLPTVRLLTIANQHEETTVTRNSHEYGQGFQGPSPTYQVISGVQAPQADVHVAYNFSNPNDDHYEIWFRPNAYSNPYVTWLIERPDGSSDYNSLHFSKYVDGYPPSSGWPEGMLERTYRYTYAVDQNGVWSWKLETAESPTAVALRAEKEQWDETAPGQWTRTLTVKDENVLTSSVTELWQEFQWGKAVVQRTTDTGSGSLVTQLGYYDDGPETAGHLKYEINPDGSWAWYVYDATGRVQTVWSTWKDAALNPPNPPNPLDVREVAYTYDPTTNLIASITERIQGVAVSRTEYVYGNDGQGHPVTTETRCLDPGSSPCSGFVTVTTYWDAQREDLKSVQHPDGRIDTYTLPVKGWYDDGGGNPANVSFTPDPNGDHEQVTIEHLFPGGGGAPGPVPNQSTEGIIVRGPGGNAVWERTIVYGSGGYDVASPIDWTVRYFDDRGRLTAVYRLDNTVVTYQNGCCGVDARTDAAGIVTTYDRDLLGRATMQTKEGYGTQGQPGYQESIVTEWDYSFSGNPLIAETTVRSGSGSLSLHTYEQYDLAGRVTMSQDAAGLQTQYTYSTSSSGGRIVSATKPDGSTVVTEYYRDGQLKRVSGTATIAKFYDYGADSDGRQWRREYVGPAGQDSPRWAETVEDALGRQVYEIRPAWVPDGQPADELVTESEYHPPDAATYIARGRPWRVKTYLASQPGNLLRAPTVYEYDAVGNTYRVGLDLGGTSGVLDNASTDRITETPTQYVNLGGSWWSETVNKVYRTDNNGTATTLGKVRERLTGLPGGTTPTIRQTQAVDFFGNTTTTTTTLDRAAKLITETTNFPATANNASRVVRNGLPQSVVSKAQLTTSFEYDGLGRRTKTIDSRNNWSRTNYDPATGQVASLDNNHGDVTVYAYFTAAEPNAGRIKSIRNANGKYTYFNYNSRGETTRTWGDVPQPTWIEYDDFGQRIALHTYRAGSGWSESTWPSNSDDDDVTAWSYDPATGLLDRKTYDDATVVCYAYTPDGQLGTRTWARLDNGNPLITTYTYSTGAAGTGELLTVAYSDATPDVEFTYNRLGDQKTARQFKGQTEIEKRTFTYAASGPRLTEVLNSGPLAGKQLRTRYQDTVAVDEGGGLVALYKFLRLSDVAFGTPGQPTADYSAVYDYDGDTDRMSNVTGPGLPNGGANYKYLGQPGSASPYPASLVERIEFKDGSTTKASITRTYESQRNLLTAVENQWGTSPVTVSRYAYENDSLGRRQWCTRTGATFDGLNGRSPAHTDVWTYNDRNELTTSDRYDDVTPPFDANPQLALDRGYEYDPIGSRISYTEGLNPSTLYTANNLNQYTGATNPTESFAYDADGNLTSDGGLLPGTPRPGGTPRKYVWDAENRLIRVEPTDGVQPVSGDLKVEFAYDYAGRRSEKKVWTWNPALGGGAGDWELTDHRRFVWFQWLLLMELRASDNVVLRKYAWGLDVQGQSGTVNSIHEAAGISGLLALQDTRGTSGTTDDYRYVYFYDANGNVGQLVDLAAANANAAQVARYEYDAYGNNLLDPTSSSQSGTYAAANPFRFSTRFFDAELGTYAYPIRIYDPKWGRWLNRDPLEELGGLNLYGFVRNHPAGLVDPLGLIPFDTIWDVLSVVYDAGKIAVGVITDNPALVAEGTVDLASDTIALAIPYVPAGATKVARLVGKNAGKVIEGGTKITIKAIKERKVTTEIVSESVTRGREFAEQVITRASKTDEVRAGVRVIVEKGDKKIVDAELDLLMRNKEEFRLVELKDWERITPSKALAINEQIARQRVVVQEFNAAFGCDLQHAGLIISDRTRVSEKAMQTLMEGKYEISRFSEFRFNASATVNPCLK